MLSFMTEKKPLVYSVLPSYCWIIYSLCKRMKKKQNSYNRSKFILGPTKPAEAIYFRGLMFEQQGSLTLMICYQSFTWVTVSRTPRSPEDTLSHLLQKHKEKSVYSVKESYGNPTETAEVMQKDLFARSLPLRINQSKTAIPLIIPFSASQFMQ